MFCLFGNSPLFLTSGDVDSPWISKSGQIPNLHVFLSVCINMRNPLQGGIKVYKLGIHAGFAISYTLKKKHGFLMK